MIGRKQSSNSTPWSKWALENGSRSQQQPEAVNPPAFSSYIVCLRLQNLTHLRMKTVGVLQTQTLYV